MLALTIERDSGLTISVPASTEPTTIRIAVVDVRPKAGKVRLGIEAPLSCPIVRDRAKKKERKATA